MGHTVKRCPQAKGDTEAAGIGGYDAGDGGDAIDGVDNINGDSWGGGAGVNTDAGGASGWMAAGDSSNNWGTAPEATKGGDW